MYQVDPKIPWLIEVTHSMKESGCLLGPCYLLIQLLLERLPYQFMGDIISEMVPNNLEKFPLVSQVFKKLSITGGRVLGE